MNTLLIPNNRTEFLSYLKKLTGEVLLFDDENSLLYKELVYRYYEPLMKKIIETNKYLGTEEIDISLIETYDNELFYDILLKDILKGKGEETIHLMALKVVMLIAYSHLTNQHAYSLKNFVGDELEYRIPKETEKSFNKDVFQVLRHCVKHHHYTTFKELMSDIFHVDIPYPMVLLNDNPILAMQLINSLELTRNTVTQSKGLMKLR